MSDVDPKTDGDRVAELAARLLRSAENDGLDDEQLASLGRRNGIAPETAAATLKVPVAAMLLAAGVVVLGAVLHRGSDARAAAAVSSRPMDPSARESAPTEPAPQATPSERTPARGEQEAPQMPDAPAPATMSVEHLPDAPVAAAAPRARLGASPPEPGEDLSAELLAVERVQQAVRQHRIADAKAALADYRRSFPNQLLGQEARVLEIEALLAEGRRDEGEARARAFLAGAGADSPYAARVRSLIARPRTP